MDAATRVLLDADGLRLLDVSCLPVDARPEPEEASRTLELVFPQRGWFRRHLGRRDILVDTTRVFAFRPGEPYRISHPRGGDRCLVLALDSAIEAEARPAVELDGRPIPARTDLAVRRLAAGLAAGRLDTLTATEAVIGLLDRLEAAEGARPRTGARAARAVDRAREVLVASPEQRLTLGHLGATVGLSPFHLARSFRQLTGSTIHEYRTRLRLRAAVDRILAGEADLAGLAFELGFADQSHMTNTFRRTLGLTPGSLRPPPLVEELRTARTILQA